MVTNKCISVICFVYYIIIMLPTTYLCCAITSRGSSTDGNAISLNRFCSLLSTCRDWSAGCSVNSAANISLAGACEDMHKNPDMAFMKTTF